MEESRAGACHARLYWCEVQKTAEGLLLIIIDK